MHVSFINPWIKFGIIGTIIGSRASIKFQANKLILWRVKVSLNSEVIPIRTIIHFYRIILNDIWSYFSKWRAFFSTFLEGNCLILWDTSLLTTVCTRICQCKNVLKELVRSIFIAIINWITLTIWKHKSKGDPIFTKVFRRHYSIWYLNNGIFPHNWGISINKDVYLVEKEN